MEENLCTLLLLFEQYNTPAVPFFLFVFILFNNSFKVDKFTKIQYSYIHKNRQTNWLIKVNYPILQKKSSMIKTKEKGKKTKNKKGKTGL